MKPSAKVKYLWMAKFEEQAIKDKLYPPGKVDGIQLLFCLTKVLLLIKQLKNYY